MVKVAEDHAGRLRLRVGVGTRALHDGWYEVVRVGWGIKCANTGLKTVCFLAPPFGCGVGLKMAMWCWWWRSRKDDSLSMARAPLADFTMSSEDDCPASS